MLARRRGEGSRWTVAEIGSCAEVLSPATQHNAAGGSVISQFLEMVGETLDKRHAKKVVIPTSKFNDGHVIPIELWHGAFQSIQVPAGNHALEFRYQSRMLKIGAWISLLSALLLAALFAHARPLIPNRR